MPKRLRRMGEGKREVGGNGGGMEVFCASQAVLRKSLASCSVTAAVHKKPSPLKPKRFLTAEATIAEMDYRPNMFELMPKMVKMVTNGYQWLTNGYRNHLLTIVNHC